MVLAVLLAILGETKANDQDNNCLEEKENAHVCVFFYAFSSWPIVLLLAIIYG